MFILIWLPSRSKQAEAPEDVHVVNKPAVRRDEILATIASLPLDINIVEVPAPTEHRLELARTVHDERFVTFLETAWARWDVHPNKDKSFCGNTATGSTSPSLIMGCSLNRDACQEAGTSVTSQACFFLSDSEAPIFGALLPTLAADEAVVRAALASVRGGRSSYALVTHPGHHASRATCQGTGPQAQ